MGNGTRSNLCDPEIAPGVTKLCLENNAGIAVLQHYILLALLTCHLPGSLTIA